MCLLEREKVKDSSSTRRDTHLEYTLVISAAHRLLEPKLSQISCNSTQLEGAVMNGCPLQVHIWGSEETIEWGTSQ